MAGFMDSLNKGLTTLNVKTSNLMETSKLKTAISTKESEISSLKILIGETVYLNRSTFNMDMVADQITEIENKYKEISDLKAQITQLEENERAILGSKDAGDNTPKIFCTKCGEPNDAENKFCEKCGNPLES